MGVTYEFRISAKNAVDFGEQAVETINTPDGSELLNLKRFTLCFPLIEAGTGLLRTPKCPVVRGRKKSVTYPSA